jgi:hypothetical protein
MFKDIMSQLSDRITHQRYVPNEAGYVSSHWNGRGDLVLIENWRCADTSVRRDRASYGPRTVIYRVDGNEQHMRVMTMADRFSTLVIDFTHWRRRPERTSSTSSSKKSRPRLIKLAEYAARAYRQGCKEIILAGIDEVDRRWLHPELVPTGSKRPPHVHQLFSDLYEAECLALKVRPPPPHHIQFLHRGHPNLSDVPSIASDD